MFLSGADLHHLHRRYESSHIAPLKISTSAVIAISIGKTVAARTTSEALTRSPVCKEMTHVWKGENTGIRHKIESPV